jgi:hypothetical protein
MGSAQQSRFENVIHRSDDAAGASMRAIDETSGALFGPVDLEQRLPAHHPSKRGSSQVQLPLPWNFMLEVAGLPVGTPAYLLTDKGKPFASSGSLDNAVRKWIIAAGLCAPVRGEDGNQLLDSNGKPKVRATRSQNGIRKGRAEQDRRGVGAGLRSHGAPVAQRSENRRDLHEAGGSRASRRACCAARRGGRSGERRPTP